MIKGFILACMLTLSGEPDPDKCTTFSKDFETKEQCEADLPNGAMFAMSRGLMPVDSKCIPSGEMVKD